MSCASPAADRVNEPEGPLFDRWVCDRPPLFIVGNDTHSVDSQGISPWILNSLLPLRQG